MKARKLLFLLSFVILIATVSNAFAHTVDSVGDYRLEIGWMQEPAVSGETNGIELYISPLKADIPLEEQEFENGIVGLEKSLKIQLVYQGQKATLPLSHYHNVPGKYYALVDPTLGGYYQANILGKIQDTTVSLSMHPPKVENKTYFEFPPLTTNIVLEHQSIQTEHKSLQTEIDEIKSTLNGIENSQNVNIPYLAMALGIAGIVLGSMAISRKKTN